MAYFISIYNLNKARIPVIIFILIGIILSITAIQNLGIIIFDIIDSSLDEFEIVHIGNIGSYGYTVFQILPETKAQDSLSSGAGDDILWHRTYGGLGSEWGYSIQVTSDDGYIIAGEIMSYDQDDWDVFLIRVDSVGNMIWNQSYGGSRNEWGSSVKITPDGSYIIAGVTSSFSESDDDVYLIKVDSGGNLIWQRTYGGVQDDLGRSVQVTSDGDYIVAGYTDSFGEGDDDVYLIKVDSGGNLIWQRTYGGPYDDRGRSVQVTSDGGYIVAGYTDSFGKGYSDFFLVKVDSSGNMVWNRTYGDRGYDRGYFVQVTSDAGYIIAGETDSFGEGYTDIFLVRTDSNGNMIWNRTYGGAGFDFSRAIQLVPDRGYIIVGETDSFDEGDTDVYLVRVDSMGNILWNQTYGGPHDDFGRSVQVTSDGSYIIVGVTSSFGEGAWDIYLVKTKQSISGNTSSEVDDSETSSIFPPETIIVIAGLIAVGLAIVLILRKRSTRSIKISAL